MYYLRLVRTLNKLLVGIGVLILLFYDILPKNIVSILYWGTLIIAFLYNLIQTDLPDVSKPPEFKAIKRKSHNILYITNQSEEKGVEVINGREQSVKPVALKIHKQKFDIFYSRLQLKPRLNYQTIMYFDNQDMVDTHYMRRKIEDYYENFKSREFLVVLGEEYPGQQLELVEQLKQNISLLEAGIEYHLVPRSLDYELIPHYVNCQGKWACNILRPSILRT